MSSDARSTSSLNDLAGVIEAGKSVVLYDGHCNFCKG
jgi:hypothetical protein